MADLASLSALGSTPLAGASPTGAAARYEPGFEGLTVEIAKLESVEGRGSVRWKDVVELSASLLAEKSKDLLVAAYLTLGLLETDGYRGLAAGLGVCRDLIKTFWEGLFPEKSRLRARANALQWMVERVGASLAGRPGADRSDREALQACGAAVEEVATLCGEKFEGSDPPDLGVLSRGVREKLDSVPGDEPPPGEPSTSDQASPAAAPVEAAPRAIDTPEAARQSLAGIREQLLAAASILRGAAPTDPLPYRLLRSAVWVEILEAPPSVEGKLELSGGDAGFAAEQEGRLDKGDYAPVVADSEARLPADPLWLDLNFYSYRAMEGLGRPYAAARKAVGDEVSRLVRCVPSLLSLKFADGRPLAGEAVSVWVQHELRALPQDAPSNGVHPAEAALLEARKLMARKQFPQATALLQKVLQSLPHRRDRFVCRLNLAKLCLDAGKPELARPQLDALDAESRQFPLEEWEPALAIDLARELWRCYKASSAPEKAEEAYARLSRLDLSAALALDKKS